MTSKTLLIVLNTCYIRILLSIIKLPQLFSQQFKSPISTSPIDTCITKFVLKRSLLAIGPPFVPISYVFIPLHSGVNKVLLLYCILKIIL